MTQADEKQKIRKLIDEILKTIEGKKEKDEFINGKCLDLINSSLKNISSVLIYSPLKDEPNLDSLIKFFNSEEINIYSSSFDEIKFQNIHSNSKSDDFSIFDLIILPGKSFTVNGDRLGRGGGWYDKALSRAKQSCILIGVCYEDQILGNLPIEEHDISVDFIVTNNNLYKKGGSVS